MKYVCGVCGGSLTHSITGKDTKQRGLGTFKCLKHPHRAVTVVRDISGGQENGKDRRKVPVSVDRHTLVVRKKENENASI